MTFDKPDTIHNVVDQIRYDHISMTRVLQFIEQELAKLKSEGKADFDLLVDCMRYMIDYAEIVHHPKEDAMMDCVYGRFKDLDELAMEQFVEKSNIVAIGHAYVDMQRSHIRLEEGRLLRQLKSLLSDKDIVEINDTYSEHRDPQLSDNFEEEYNSLYRSLVGF